MKSRKDIKSTAKERLSERYWGMVGSTFFLLLIISSLYSGVIGMIFAIFFQIGFNYYMLEMYRDSSTTINTAFKNLFTARKLGGYLWMCLFEFLWSLLFVIPGIIKAYSYAMTPYILADQPEVKAKDALKLSMQMMRGHKWQLFVFQLSFIGWDILTLLTFGILDTFYVGPYKACSLAGFYEELKNYND